MSAKEPAFRQIGTRPPRPDGVDKVTGRARYGADYTLPGMVWGRVLRSPHAHARILGIDASAALALPGVIAVVTAEDFLAAPQGDVASGESEIASGDLSRNVMAREKVLYHGHAVAAVAATTPRIAAAALAADPASTTTCCRRCSTSTARWHPARRCCTRTCSRAGWIPSRMPPPTWPRSRPSSG